jgi:hypothetical protein
MARESGFEVLELLLIEWSAQTIMLGLVVILELLWIRILRLPVLKNLRTNIMPRRHSRSSSIVPATKPEIAVY